MRTGSLDNRKLVVESAAFGLGYTAVLIWSGSALVASFSNGEGNPYWPAIPHLRTDTAGALAFGVAIISLVVSRYLQLRRRSDAPLQPVTRSAGVLAVQAVADTAVVLATGIVIYLSLNAVTHPVTLQIQLTHLLPWPSEGTVRVIALVICLIAVATRRYLRATASRPSQPAPVPEKPGVAAPASHQTDWASPAMTSATMRTRPPLTAPRSGSGYEVPSRDQRNAPWRPR